MQIPYWAAMVVGELLFLFIGLAVFLFIMLWRLDARWKRLLKKAKGRISELKAVEGRYEQAKENLHRYMKGFSHLKQKLEDAESDPVQMARIQELEQELEQAQAAAEAAALVKVELQESRGEADSLREQLSAVANNVDKQTPPAPSYEHVQASGNGIELWDEPLSGGKTAFVHEIENWRARSRQELGRLRDTSQEQRRMIYDLSTKLASVNADQSMDEAARDDYVLQLERNLKESETCIQVLEDELTSLQGKIHDYDELASTQERADELPAAETVVSDHDQESEQLKNQLAMANQMITTMMKANGDQSNIIGFARRGTACQTLEDLAVAVLDTVANYGLAGSLQIRAREGVINRSSQGAVTPQELIHLGDMDSADRYKEIDDDLLIRHTQVSLLIKNMLVDDAEQVSRFRDSLAVAMELAVAELDNIEASYAMQHNQSVLNQVIASTRKIMLDVENPFAYQARESEEIMGGLSKVMEDKAFSESVDPAFGKAFKDTMIESKQRFAELHAKAVSIHASFAEIMANLDVKEE